MQTCTFIKQLTIHFFSLFSTSQDVSKNKLIDSVVGKFKDNLKSGLEAVSFVSVCLAILFYFLAGEGENNKIKCCIVLLIYKQDGCNG